MPRFGGYILVKETVVDADGWSRSVFTKLPHCICAGGTVSLGQTTYNKNARLLSL
ncbi:hypothetical protein P175DRAFT_0497257 [Aspergillus ochraceoroseus IBT 24754]|uniref:Uncharacterized protein n=1 Tax=Aspergillus ochraceoroseus IBT 24754 TaxID=1392256 RepID=A0A2T5M6H1_9EURO|nr:uncharacterized protein P175DRAFT_0497257 [Aspergillus ochraceoroseus IBT 24754]PTU24138.1 hypothetical protein P175DRAFT_0497257 [Aspergillus ochraceoroseus IBT 24754]